MSGPRNAHGNVVAALVVQMAQSKQSSEPLTRLRKVGWLGSFSTTWSLVSRKLARTWPLALFFLQPSQTHLAFRSPSRRACG